MNTLKVAAIQMTSGTKWQDNLQTAADFIREASNNGAKLVVLPEFFIQLNNSKTSFIELAEEIGIGEIQQTLKNIAKECNIFLVAGTIPIKSKVINKCYNTTIVYNPNGDMICYYNKVHLFNLNKKDLRIDERVTFEYGEDIVTFNINNFSFGLSICYDLRFPELFREMVGVDAIIIPAAFTYYTGKAHWEILLRARAIENQCYIIAAAQSGKHESGHHTFGHSMVVDPWGNISTILKSGTGIIMDTINRETIENIRAELPALQHKKF